MGVSAVDIYVGHSGVVSECCTTQVIDRSGNRNVLQSGAVREGKRTNLRQAISDGNIVERRAFIESIGFNTCDVARNDDSGNIGTHEASTETEDVAVAGKFISYKKKFANDEIYDNVLQPNKFPLHKALEGHKVGDVVTFQGKKYEIIGL